MFKRLSTLILLVLSLFSVSAPVAIADQQPEFSHLGLDGKTYRLSDFRGKWVVVNYWATWCPPCLEEMPELDLFHNAHKDKNAIVLGLNMEDIAEDKLRAWVEEQFLSFPILRDRPRAKTEFGTLFGLPSTYIVDPEGNYVARQVGPVTAKMLTEFIEAAEAEKATEVAKAPDSAATSAVAD